MLSINFLIFKLSIDCLILILEYKASSNSKGPPKPLAVDNNEFTKLTKTFKTPILKVFFWSFLIKVKKDYKKNTLFEKCVHKSNHTLPFHFLTYSAKNSVRWNDSIIVLVKHINILA